MNKRERISQWLAELGRETGDGPPSGRLDTRPEGATASADATLDGNLAEHPFYVAFFRCWNEQRYYEAHDVLEQLWLKKDSSDADFFKGLIQAAGAFVHLQKQFEHPLHVKHGRRLRLTVRRSWSSGRNIALRCPDDAARQHDDDDICLSVVQATQRQRHNREPQPQRR